MLRQNRSEGSSTFSVFRQACPVTGSPEDLPIQRRTMSPVHFHDGTTFPHSLCSGRGPGVNPHQRCHTFSKEPLFLMPPGRARSPRGNQGNRVRKAGPPHYFRGNHFSSFLPAEIGLPSTASRSARRESLHMFLREPLFLLPSGRDWRSRKHGHWADRRPPHVFRGNHFPSFRWVHRRPLAAISLQQFFL